MFRLFKKKIRPFSYMEQGEANQYVIMKFDNWFMSIQVNGEFTVTGQKMYMEQLVEALNRNY